jgi:isocitrate dehydrogenase
MAFGDLNKVFGSNVGGTGGVNVNPASIGAEAAEGAAFKQALNEETKKADKSSAILSAEKGVAAKFNSNN